VRHNPWSEADCRVPALSALLVLTLLPALSGCRLLRRYEGHALNAVPVRERYNAAWNLVMNGRYEDAIEPLNQLITKIDPEIGLAGDALFWLGYSYQRLNRREEAIGAYERLIAEHPGSGYANLARDELAVIRSKRSRNEAREPQTSAETSNAPMPP